MSSDNLEAVAGTCCCASCGTAEEADDVNLKKCPDCDIVKYCSDKCKKDHLPQHEQASKERAAGLRDEILFRRPECSHYGDCPICFLPLSIDIKKSTVMGCCYKMICDGCAYANWIRQQEDRLHYACPFCRQPMQTDEEIQRNTLKRVAANDPLALLKAGKKLYEEGDYRSAFEYCSKAAELGNAEAHYNLSVMYGEGYGVEKDEKKGLYHLEEAAIAGHPKARHNLGCEEWENGRIDRAMKHLIIAANLGCDDSIQALKGCYIRGEVSKEEFAAALRAHQAAVDATKSPQREEAAKYKALYIQKNFCGAK